MMILHLQWHFTTRSVIFTHCVDWWHCIFAELELPGAGQDCGRWPGAFIVPGCAEEVEIERLQADAVAVMPLQDMGHGSWISMNVYEGAPSWKSQIKEE